MNEFFPSTSSQGQKAGQAMGLQRRSLSEAVHLDSVVLPEKGTPRISDESLRLFLDSFLKYYSCRSEDPVNILTGLTSFLTPLLSDDCLFHFETSHLESSVNVVRVYTSNQKAGPQENVKPFSFHDLPDTSSNLQWETPLLGAVTDLWLKHVALDEDCYQKLRSLNLCYMVSVPIQAFQANIGRLTLFSSHKDAPYLQECLEKAELVASQVAFLLSALRSNFSINELESAVTSQSGLSSHPVIQIQASIDRITILADPDEIRRRHESFLDGGRGGSVNQNKQGNSHDDLEAEAALPDMSDLRILVLDDDPDIRDLVGEMLEWTGASVDRAANVEDAVGLLRNNIYQVVISDIAMPGLDGYAFIEDLKKFEAESGRRIPAVALTGFSRAEDSTNVLQAGFQMHLPKPVEFEQLISAVGWLSGKGDLHSA